MYPTQSPYEGYAPEPQGGFQQQAPTYGTPPQPAYLNQPPQGALYPQVAGASTSRNVLGVLSLIAPFVCLAPVGIVLGHLGLSAAKKGKASNRGVALAGTILSWVVTVLGLALGALSVAGAFAASSSNASAGDVHNDLKTLQVAVATELAAHPEQLPAISLDGANYTVGSQTIPATKGVDAVSIIGSVQQQYFCIEAWWGDDVASITQDAVVRDAACESIGGDQQGDPSATASDDAGPTQGEILPPTVAVGDCVKDPYAAAQQQEDGTWLTSAFEVVPCDQPHYGEIFAVGSSQFPAFDDQGVISEADAFCLKNFEAYVGIAYDQSTLYYDYFYPSADSWEVGDRELSCMLNNNLGDVTGSLKGSGQ